MLLFLSNRNIFLSNRCREQHQSLHKVLRGLVLRQGRSSQEALESQESHTISGRYSAFEFYCFSQVNSYFRLGNWLKMSICNSLVKLIGNTWWCKLFVVAPKPVTHVRRQSPISPYISGDYRSAYFPQHYKALTTSVSCLCFSSLQDFPPAFEAKQCSIF